MINQTKDFNYLTALTQAKYSFRLRMQPQTSCFYVSTINACELLSLGTETSTEISTSLFFCKVAALIAVTF